MDSGAVPSRRVSPPAFSFTVQPTGPTVGSDCLSKANSPPFAKRFRQEHQIGCSVIPYLVQDGEPRFLLVEQQLAQGADRAIHHFYQPEPALLRHILVDEFGRLAERLFFLRDLGVHYDPAAETLDLHFSRCRATEGELCQLPMILGAHFLKNRQPSVSDGRNTPPYSPHHMAINLNSTTVTYTSVTGETHCFLLAGAAPGASNDSLWTIHRLLLQRALGELLYNQRILERLQTAGDHPQQQSLLQPLASCDRLTIDDPDRLGFRIMVLDQQGEGVSLTLTELNRQVAEQVWGSSDPQQLLGRVSGLLNHFCPQLSATVTASAVHLAVSIHQLAAHLQQDTSRCTSVAIINNGGCILRVPSSPNGQSGDSKTRLSPLLGAIVAAQAESGILPANLDYWHRLSQKHPDLPSDKRVFVVEPPGYHCPAICIKDQDVPGQGFDNQRRRWFSFADLRAGALGDWPLRAECSDIVVYLAFEQQRLNAALAPLFSGVTVTIAGADGDLRAIENLGLITISAARRSQDKGIRQWLEATGLRFESLPGRAELTLFDNPYTVFRVFTAQFQGTDQYRPVHKPLTPYFRKRPDQPPAQQPKQASLANAVQELQVLGEKLGVADLYRTLTRGRQGDQEMPLPTDGTTLIPLQTDAEGEGLYCDRDRGHWYRLKPCQDREAARSEVLMAQLAKGSGLNVPDADLLQEPHNSWIISRWQPGLQTGEQALAALDKPQLARLLITAAWLGNGNLIGCHYNHVGVDDRQQAYGLNWCGAGYYRGDRTRKQLDSDGHGGFFGTVFELKALRDISQHPEAAKVFASLTEEDIAAVVPEFLHRAGKGMQTLVEAYGPAEAWERQQLTITLYERLNDLAMRYPDHLPRLTRAELKVIPLHGLHGSQLAVRSEHIRDHVLTIGCAVDEGDSGPGEQQQPLTQISFRLTPEKTAEFADKLELGHRDQNLRERIAFLLSYTIQDKVMTRLLRQEARETRKQVQILRQKLQDHLDRATEEQQAEGQQQQAGNQTVTVPIIWTVVRKDKRGKYLPWGIDQVSDTIEELNGCINALEQLAITPIGSKPKQHHIWTGSLPHFAAPRVRSDWTDSRPCYQVLADGSWQRQPEPQQDPEARAAPRKGTPFAGGAFCYRIEFDPRDQIRADGLPQPGIAMQMEFHGPDSDAYALEGQVRLLVSAEPNRATINHVLEWLEANQLDTRRPDHACMQRHYLEKLAERTGGITGFGSGSSTATELADLAPDWRDYTRREGGRMVMMLPESDRLSAKQRAQIRPTHNLLFSSHRPLADLLDSVLRGGASLESFQNRVNQGQPADGVGTVANIVNGGANLVFTQTETAQKALSRVRLIFRPGLFNRADTQVVENVTGQSQPWFRRHRHRPLADLITVPDLQFNLTGSLSLPEWLEHINVPNHGERQQILRTFREIGIGRWPGGQPLTELIRVTQSLRQQYDDCLSQWSSLSDQLQHLVARVGFDQFSQLLAVNPELQLGKLVSLEGIRLKDVTLCDYDLAALCLRNCQLDDVTLIDCQVVGADLGACDLTGVTWVFNRPEQQGADIDYLSAHLEHVFTTTGNVLLLEKLLALLVDTNRTRHTLIQEWLGDVDHPAVHCQLAILNRKAGTPLDQVLQELRRIINRFPDSSVWQQLTLTDLCGIRAAVPVAKLLTLETQSEPWQSFISLLVDMTCDLSQNPAANTIRSQFYQQAFALWPDEPALYIDAIAEIDKYTLSPAGNDSQITNAAAWTLALCERGLQRFQDPVIQQRIFNAWLSLSATTEQSKALSLVIKHLGLDLAWRYYPDMKARLPSLGVCHVTLSDKQRKAWTDFYHQALDLWPDRPDLHIDWICGIKNNNLMICRGESWVRSDAWALEACQQALKQCPTLADRERIFNAWLSLSATTEQSKALSLAIKRLGPDLAWRYYPNMKARLPSLGVRHVTLSDEQREAWTDFYHQALDLWPDRPDLHIDWICGIKNNNLIICRGESWVRSDAWALEACQQALEQCPTLADRERIFNAWLSLSATTEQSKALSLAIKRLGPDLAWRYYPDMKARLPSLGVRHVTLSDKQREAWTDFYHQALDLWPDRPDLHIDWICGIKNNNLMICRDESWVRSDAWALEACQQALKQCPTLADRERIFNAWLSLSATTEQSKALSLAIKRLGPDLAWRYYPDMKARLPSLGVRHVTLSDKQREAWTDFYHQALDLWPDRPDLHIDWICGIKNNNLMICRDESWVRSDAWALEACQQALEQCPTLADRERIFNAWLSLSATTEQSKALSLAIEYLGPDRAWCCYPDMKARLPSLGVRHVTLNDKQREAWTDFYHQALDLWPDRPEVYMDWITSIK